MKTKIKYAEHSALKWQSEDFDATVESMLDSEVFAKEKLTALLSLDESEKLEIIECAMERISSYLCEMIFEEVREQITIKLENNG
jgi:hypothetical protein